MPAVSGAWIFIKLQEHQTDLIAVGEEPVAARMSDLLHLGVQFPKVINEGIQACTLPRDPSRRCGVFVTLASDTLQPAQTGTEPAWPLTINRMHY